MKPIKLPENFDAVAQSVQNSISRMNAELTRANTDVLNQQARRDDLSRATAEATIETASALKTISDALNADRKKRDKVEKSNNRNTIIVATIAGLTLVATILFGILALLAK